MNLRERLQILLLMLSKFKRINQLLSPAVVRKLTVNEMKYFWETKRLFCAISLDRYHRGLELSISMITYHDDVSLADISYSTSTMETPVNRAKYVWSQTAVNGIVVLVSFLCTLNRFHTLFSSFYRCFWASEWRLGTYYKLFIIY